jgi:hypothetical protein
MPRSVAVLFALTCSVAGASGFIGVTQAATISTHRLMSAPSQLGSRARHKCAASPSGSGILRDGDFSKDHDPGSWQTFYKGEGLAQGWTVIRRSSDLYGSQVNRFPNGECSVDLDGFHPGAISSASFPTTPSAAYTVTFLLSGNGGGPPTVKTMQVEAAGQSETLQWDTSGGQSAENGVYQTETWTFTADSVHARLIFRSLDPNAHIAGWGPVVAQISVAQNAPLRRSLQR